MDFSVPQFTNDLSPFNTVQYGIIGSTVDVSVT